MMSSDPLEFGDNYQPGTFILDGSLMSDALGGDINMSNYDFINPTAADTAATNLSALFHSDLAQNDGDNTADSQIRVSASFSTMQVSDVMLTAASSQHYLIPRQDSVPASQSSMVVISAQPSSAPGQTGQVIHMLNPVSTVSLPVSNSTQPQAIVARTGLSPSQMSPILVERLHSSVHVMRSMPSTNGHVVQRVHAPDPRSDVQNDYPKPQFSYSCLIALALKNSESGSLPVRDIYKFMTTHFPYYKTARDGWKNSVRHNLSMNKCFEKLGDPTRATGSKKGSHWRMIPAKRGKMEDEINKSKNKDIDGLRRSMAYPEKLELIEQGRAGIPRDRMGPIARQPRTPSSCSNSSAGSGQVESPPNIPDNMETILEGDLFSTIPEMSDVTNWIQSNQNDVIDMLNADGTPPSPTQVLGLGNSQGSQGPMSPMTLSQFTIPNALNLQIQPHEGSDSRSSADVLSPSPGGVMTSSYPPSPSALLNGSQLSPLDFGQQSPLGGLLGRGAHSPLGLGRSSSRNHHHIFDFPDIPHSPQMAMQPPSRPSSQGTLPP